MLKIGGLNDYYQLDSNSNNMVDGRRVISAPFYISLNVYSLLSYSIYHNHSVWITKDGQVHCIGDNTEGQISPLLPKIIHTKATTLTLSIKSTKVDFISAVCGSNYTLYMVYNQSTNQVMLAYSYCNKKQDSQYFLNIGFRKPIGLFGGDVNCAAIDSRGSIIIINSSVFDTQNASPYICNLPENEKAISVACLNKFIFVLSKSGRLFMSPISLVSKEPPSFKFVDEFYEKIINISGTREHCFVVTAFGKVFGFGFNSFGQLGINSPQKAEKFIYINSLSSYSIINAYAGYVHSFFQTADGMILACGKSSYCSLLINDNKITSFISNPTITEIKKGASFCVAGSFLSAVFVNCKPPVAIPNKIISDENYSLVSIVFHKQNADEKISEAKTYTASKLPNISDKNKFSKTPNKYQTGQLKIDETENKYLEKIATLNKQVQSQSNQINDLQKKERVSMENIANLNKQIQLKSKN